MRAILGIIAGLVVAYLVFTLLGIIGVGATYSVPHGLDLYDSRAVVELLLAMPAAPKIALLFALFGGVLVGATLAKLIWRRSWAAWTVAILYAILAALSVMPLPIAGWMQALTTVLPIIAGLLANHLIAARAPALPDEAASTTDT